MRADNFTFHFSAGKSFCSKAEKSLAIVAYSQDPQAVKKHAISSKWFIENEIVLL